VVGLNGSSIGNHEFDFGKEFLEQFLAGRDSPNLAANLESERGEKNFLPKQRGSQLYTLPNGVKIGVVGLSTLETPTTTSGFVSGKFPPYRFLPYKEVVMRHSNLLKSQGAHAILIVSHLGDDCNSDIRYAIRTENS
jgi:2',3'-cyclic-nucleotide 2'-phosphodiesterase (5'-nucleotidase family)